ncbi:DUF2946 domain-containing protein [Massilia niastensis]|uniref:DUF2946 domain-containing protein n=1 Tax=Massilia niastensis TaxID=544911 RepID=UPI000372CE26|nr:DUF2946 domain-containing protein [Massilia niastensis]
MNRLRRSQSLYGWTVLLAFLFGLFVPMASHATAPLGYTAEICSATGTRHVMIMVDHAMPQDNKAMQGMAHCDLCCSQHQQPLAPPGQPDIAMPLERERDPYPPLFYHAPAPQFAWTAAQSRGPPSTIS